MRTWVVGNLKKGDMARIAEMAGTEAGYVKQLLRYRPNAKSTLAMRVWLKAYRYLRIREELQGAC
jgi:hypothetical protein